MHLQHFLHRRLRESRNVNCATSNGNRSDFDDYCATVVSREDQDEIGGGEELSVTRPNNAENCLFPHGKALKMIATGGGTNMRRKQQISWIYEPPFELKLSTMAL